jgi:hypothetical protein
VVLGHERVEEQGLPRTVVNDGHAAEDHDALVLDGGVAFIAPIGKHLARDGDFETHPRIVANIILQVTLSTRVVQPDLAVEPDIQQRAHIRGAIRTDGGQVATVARGQQLVEFGLRHQLVGATNR